MSDDGRKNWFDALYLTAEKPFDGRWGFRVNYTLGKAEAIGGDFKPKGDRNSVTTGRLSRK